MANNRSVMLINNDISGFLYYKYVQYRKTKYETIP